MAISHPMLDGDGEIAEKWERYFSDAVGGLLANPEVVSKSVGDPTGIERALKLAKQIADKAVTIKPN